MSELLETIMESREESMVSPVGDSKPTLRIAHFLKPISKIPSSSSPSSSSPSMSSSSLPPTFEPKKWPLTVKFNGWLNRPKKWGHWVDSLHSTYESVWKKVGIYEAIMSTKYSLYRNEELIFGIAEKWCSKTNTFVFPWGESTITLEDIMILGGYPVLGGSIFTSLETQELREIEEKLIQGRIQTGKSKSNKACISKWICIFMNSGREIEHEAFLSAWLSMFVFPEKSLLIRKSVLPIATHLANGNPIALAPAVLASIYKDLTLLKQTIVDSTKEEHLELALRSPFYLVQLWLWERFEVLQPKPNVISHGEDPILARWHRIRALEIDNVRSVLESSMEEFIWRPYARFAGKRKKFYAENSMWVPNDDHALDEETMSFVMCLRVSELVGLDCIEQYLPHRVCMQFGMDQDVPGCVNRINQNAEIAWMNYSRGIVDSNLYIPSRFFEADVTTRYAEWWKQKKKKKQKQKQKQSVVVQHHHHHHYEDPLKNVVKRKRSPRSSSKKKKRGNKGNDGDFPPGFPPKYRKSEIFTKTDVSENSIEKKGSKDHDCGSLAGKIMELEMVKPPLAKVKTETSMGEDDDDERVNNNIVCGTDLGESSSYTLEQKIMDLENRICRLEGVFKILSFSHCSKIP